MQYRYVLRAGLGIMRRVEEKQDSKCTEPESNLWKILLNLHITNEASRGLPGSDNNPATLHDVARKEYDADYIINNIKRIQVSAR